MERDFRVTVRVRNARILRLVEERGFRSLAALCEAFGLDYQSVSSLVRLGRRPVSAAGDWTNLAFDLATALGREPEEIWPQYIRHLTFRGRIERDLSLDDLRELPAAPTADLTAGDVTKMLACLSPREERVMRLRYGLGDAEGHSLRETGLALNVSPERIRQMEHKALRTIRRQMGVPALT